MSKMGQELDKRLDENKYAMYEALKKMMQDWNNGEIEIHYKTRELINKTLVKIEGTDETIQTCKG